MSIPLTSGERPLISLNFEIGKFSPFNISLIAFCRESELPNSRNGTLPNRKYSGPLRSRTESFRFPVNLKFGEMTK
jgi:hypothetical protein